MPNESTAVSRLSRVEREALAGELIGAAVDIPASAALRRPVRGTIVDESLSTFSIRVPGRSRTVCVAKNRLEGTIVLAAG